MTALALLAGFLVALFVLPKPASAIAFAVLAALMGWEWAGLMRIDRGGRLAYVIFIFASCVLAYQEPQLAYPKLWLLSACFWLLAAPVWLWRGWKISSNPVLGYVVGGVLIVPTWSAMAALQDRNPWWLFAAMALVWVADIAAYFAGRAWGRRKLAPSISPGKTWEGVGGAVVGVMVYGVCGALVAGISPLDHLAWAPLLIALTAVGIMGDLFESMIKRQAGVKDSSRLLPGHGGFLDRLDSQTSTLPMAALILLGTQP